MTFGKLEWSFIHLRTRDFCLRASLFDISDVGIEFVGFRKHGCAFSSSHLGLPYTLVTNKINAI